MTPEQVRELVKRLRAVIPDVPAELLGHKTFGRLVTSLRAERDLHRKNQCEAANVIESLAARVADLEADGERLDWIESTEALMERFNEPPPNDEKRFWSVFAHASDSYDGESLRDAIDAAMKAEPEAERDRLKADMDMLFSEVSCNRCRSPMTAGCYACDAIQARAERDVARAKLAAVREYAEDRKLVGVPVEGFAGAILALLDGEPRRGP